MRFLELRLNHFGKFHHKTLTLKDGINLIYGENEAGKSTIHSFIRGMLFGIEKSRGRASKDDLYTRYQPWDTIGQYSGSMDLLTGDTKIRIIRNFDKNNKNTSILNLTTGRELPQGAKDLTNLYEGLTEAGFRNTISIEQLKSRTDQELAGEVRNYIANLSLTKSKEVDVTKALAYLQTKRKELLAKQPAEKLRMISEEIELSLRIEERKKELEEKIRYTTEEEQAQRQVQKEEEKKLLADSFSDIESYNAYLERFPVIEEKYRIYEEKAKQKKLLTNKLNQISNTEMKEAHITSQMIREGIIKLENLVKDIEKIKDTKEVFCQKEAERIKSQARKKSLLFLTTFLVGCLGVVLSLITGKGLFAPLWSVVIAAGIIYNIQASGKLKPKQVNIKQLEQEYEKEQQELKGEKVSILTKFEAENLTALQNMYQEVFQKEMEGVHLLKQREEYNHQLFILKEELKCLEEDIVIYAKGFGNRPFENIYDRGEAEKESFIKSLGEFVAREKRNLVYYKQESARTLEEIRLKKEKMIWERNRLCEEEEKRLENQALKERLEKEQKEIDEELQAVELAIETINRLSVDIHDTFGQELNQRASGLADEITRGKYGTIKIDEKLNVKVGYEDNYYLINRFSSGTMEQMYFALRMAVSDIMYGKGVMPVLLDDCFALYDDERTAAVLSYLSEKRDGQILLFTCHKRERRILSECNINYHYIDLNGET